jgi:hypothetical protein
VYKNLNKKSFKKVISKTIKLCILSNAVAEDSIHLGKIEGISENVSDTILGYNVKKSSASTKTDIPLIWVVVCLNIRKLTI